MEIKAGDSLDQYIDRLPNLLQFATENKVAQMEILKRLGVAVIMYPEGDYKSVDWALFTDRGCAHNDTQARL